MIKPILGKIEKTILRVMRTLGGQSISIKRISHSLDARNVNTRKLPLIINNLVSKEIITINPNVAYTYSITMESKDIDSLIGEYTEPPMLNIIKNDINVYMSNKKDAVQYGELKSEMNSLGHDDLNVIMAIELLIRDKTLHDLKNGIMVTKKVSKVPTKFNEAELSAKIISHIKDAQKKRRLFLLSAGGQPVLNPIIEIYSIKNEMKKNGYEEHHIEKVIQSIVNKQLCVKINTGIKFK